MIIKEITIKIKTDCVSGEIYYKDTYENGVVYFEGDDDYGWQQWGAGRDILVKTSDIMRLIFEENSLFIDDLKTNIK